jgi:hypothetical protein
MAAPAQPRATPYPAWNERVHTRSTLLSRLSCALTLGGTLLLAGLLSGCDGRSSTEPVGEDRNDSTDVGDPAMPPVPTARTNLSIDAKADTHEMLLEDLAAVRHPSDGGGRAWLEGETAGVSLPASSRQRFEIVFETGPLGIADGGTIFLLASPFWDWDSPQVRYPELPGYTEIEHSLEGVFLDLDDGASLTLIIEVGGRALVEGERLRIVYGAGSAGAHIDSYAEKGSRIYIGVDGDGDGIRELLADSPSIDIHGGPPALLQATLPTTARPNERVRLTLATLDARGNASELATGALSFIDPPPGLMLPERVVFEPSHRGRRTIEVSVREPGIHRVRVLGHGGLAGLVGESNPLVVREQVQPVLWADLHGHSQISDGTGTPSDYFDYARNVAALDVSALTDHDHWGMRSLDRAPDLWQTIQQAVEAHHAPGRFVTLLGYEWTSWLHGHRHVLYFENEGEVYSSIDAAYETPDLLWRALEGQAAMTFAHHSAGGPISTNWRYVPDPILEPLTEIVSVHGSSESLDSPGSIYNPVPGNFVRDALGAGYRFGFIGSGDSHDGHPGLTTIAASGQGGLAAILSEDRTRAGVLAAMRARRVYATNGVRIYLDVRIDDQPMGTTLAPAEGMPKNHLVSIDVVGTGPIDRVDIIRSGITATISGEGRPVFQHSRVIPRLQPGEFHYVRVIQQNGGVAWSSPIYAD